MTLTQAVRHIIVDRPAGSLFVRHEEGQISADSDAMVQLKYLVVPGYVQVGSCSMVWAMYSDGIGVEGVAGQLVDSHNSMILSR